VLEGWTAEGALEAADALGAYWSQARPSHSATREKEQRKRIRRDCKRLIRESKELIKHSPEIFGSDEANALSEVFGKTTPKRNSKAARAWSRNSSRV